MMKNTHFKKMMSAVLCFALIVAMALTGCGTTETNVTTVTDGQTVGEGNVSFPLTIVDKESNEINVTIKTDKEIVGDALEELGLIEGDESEYGMYVKAVNGIVAIYEEDATYWAFYINGEYAQTGVDSTPIVDGESYMLKVEKY